MGTEIDTSDAFDEKYSELLALFQSQYGPRQGGLAQHVAKVVELLEGEGGLEKSSNIPHLPITWRMKTLDSAVSSLKRRLAARMKRQAFKTRLEKHEGQKWEDYWRVRKSEHRILDVGPFHDVDSMFGALHDIGGVRICVYFPGDVQKVVDFLEEKSRRSEVIEVVHVVQRGQGIAPDMVRLKDYVDTLDRQDEVPNDGATSLSISEKKMFAGYRATHVIVQLRPTAEPEGYKHFRSKNYVEIQVATVVMHAWSQIEHDIIYKTGLDLPSESEKSILDTFNGIVMTGESLLGQLARHRQEREELRVQTKTVLAQDRYEFGAWLLKACRERKIDLRKSAETTFHWFKLNILFNILQANAKHSYGELEKLVAKAIKAQGATSIGYDLPVYLLQQLCHDERPPSNKVTYENESDAFDGTRFIARSMAQRVVRSLNMAVFLGIDDIFVRRTRDALKTEPFKDLLTPSMCDMLDLLHPKQPRLNWVTHRKIKQFCEAFLNRDKFKSVEKDPLQLALLQLPTMLTEAGYIACPVVEGVLADYPGEEFRIVPRDLCVFLDDKEHTHWIPEIFLLGEYMAAKKNCLGVNLLNIKNVRLGPGLDFKETTLPPVPSKRNNPDSLTRLASLGLTRMSMVAEFNNGDGLQLQIDNKEVPVWWQESKERIGSTAKIELHIDKNTKRPIPHLGYFMSTYESEESPTWRFMSIGASRWEVKKNKNYTARDQQPKLAIRDHHERKNDFLELAKSLNPQIGLKFLPRADESQNISEYSFSFEGIPFHLLSTPAEFILKEDPKDELNSDGRVQDDHAATVHDELKSTSNRSDKKEHSNDENVSGNINGGRDVAPTHEKQK